MYETVDRTTNKILKYKIEKFIVYLKVRQKETENKTFTFNYVARDNSEQEDDKMVNLMKV